MWPTSLSTYVHLASHQWLRCSLSSPWWYFLCLPWALLLSRGSYTTSVVNRCTYIRSYILLVTFDIQCAVSTGALVSTGVVQAGTPSWARWAPTPVLLLLSILSAPSGWGTTSSREVRAEREAGGELLNCGTVLVLLLLHEEARRSAKSLWYPPI